MWKKVWTWLVDAPTNGAARASESYTKVELTFDHQPSIGFEAMTVDELIEWKLAKKRQIQALQAELQVVHEIYNRKLLAWHANEALKRVGLEGIMVTPGAANLKVKGQ